jgi:uncharacterized membrane protein
VVSNGRSVGAVASVVVCVVAVPVGVVGLGAAAYQRHAERSVSVARAGDVDVDACRVERVTGPDGEFVAVIALDPAGRIVVGRYRTGRTWWIARWVDGRVETVPFDFPIVTPAAVNTAGVIVGTGSAGDGVDFPWMYRDGRLVRLTLPSGARVGAASGINGRGDIVGTAGWTPPGGNGRTRAVRWPADRPGEVEVLAHPAAWPVDGGGEEPIDEAISLLAAYSITDDGVVVGSVRREPVPGEEDRRRGKRDDGQLAYLWTPDGKGGYPRPAGLPPITSVRISGDWAIGTYGHPDDRSDVDLRWNRASGEVTELRPFSPSTIDATGRMLGASGGRPALWQHGTVRHLPTLPPDDTGRALRASTDSRVITGELKSGPHSGPLAVIWRC